ncbi:MAG: hypothetical protein IPN20_00950 [Haliscomenobacter sp.]|nr:hypothetical protein [Haliscomenobacter sp.]
MRSPNPLAAPALGICASGVWLMRTHRDASMDGFQNRSDMPQSPVQQRNGIFIGALRGPVNTGGGAFGPQSGLSTSQRPINRQSPQVGVAVPCVHRCHVVCGCSAGRQGFSLLVQEDQPQRRPLPGLLSAVALPPNPRRLFLAPRSSAWAINSPTP